MISVASSGTTDRIAARILPKVPRAGSGTPARYSSTLFGALLTSAAGPRLLGFSFFIPAMLQGLPFQIHASPSAEWSGANLISSCIGPFRLVRIFLLYFRQVHGCGTSAGLIGPLDQR